MDFAGLVLLLMLPKTHSLTIFATTKHRADPNSVKATSCRQNEKLRLALAELRKSLPPKIADLVTQRARSGVLLLIWRFASGVWD